MLEIEVGAIRIMEMYCLVSTVSSISAKPPGGQHLFLFLFLFLILILILYLAFLTY
jgi:hypothetical protein